MGSGTFGGGGGGGGAWGGGGAPTISVPQITFRGGRPIAGGGGAGGAVRDALRKQLQFGDVLATRTFCSPLTDAVYRAIFDVNVVSVLNRDWRPIEKKYGVGPGPGCLVALSIAIVDRAAGNEPDKRVIEYVRGALDEFFITALRNDMNTFLHGDAEAVFARLDPKVFVSTSAYFLGGLLLQMVLKTIERSASQAELKAAAMNVADRVIDAFKATFLHKDGVLYNDFYQVACKNQPWFFTQLRK